MEETLNKLLDDEADRITNIGVFLGTLPAAKMSYALKSTPLSTGKLVLPVDDEGNAMCQANNRVELWDNDERVDVIVRLSCLK